MVAKKHRVGAEQMDEKLYIEVHYTTKIGTRETFYQRIVELGIDRLSRQEEGNRKYDFFWNAEDENDLCLLEIWDSVEAHKAHTQTEHFRKLTELKAEMQVETTHFRYLARPE